MKRRDLLGGATFWPVVASGQQRAAGRVPTVSFVGFASAAADRSLFEPFAKALAELGYVEGRTVRLETRYAEGDIERARALVAELAAIPVDVFLSPGPAASRTLARTTAIPVVAVALPSAESIPGLYASLARPGGTVTGFSAYGEEMSAKRIQLLKDILPGLKTVGVVHNATDPTFAAWGAQTVTDAARQGLEAVDMALDAVSKEAVAATMHGLRERGGGAAIVIRDFLTAKLIDEICAAGRANGIAVVVEEAGFAEAGALLSYGADISDLSRRAAGYAGRILKGERAGDLPIQLPTKFELVVNLGTAKLLGLALPPLILARADRLID